jgi:ribosome recycling factor
MKEEVEFILETAKEHMQNALAHLKKELMNIRAGKASPAMLHGVQVEYYGSLTPLSQVSNINTPDGKTITIQPWEKSMLQEIERAIMAANLGFNPMNNGESIIINIPALTEERRKQLTKLARAEAENDKISVRNARKEANDDIKKLQKEGLSEDLAKDAENDIQDLTNAHIKQIDTILEAKEKEIMTV